MVLTAFSWIKYFPFVWRWVLRGVPTTFWSVVALLTKRTGLSTEAQKKSASTHKVWTVSLKNHVTCSHSWGHWTAVCPREVEQGPWRLQDFWRKKAPPSGLREHQAWQDQVPWWPKEKWSLGAFRDLPTHWFLSILRGSDQINFGKMQQHLFEFMWLITVHVLNLGQVWPWPMPKRQTIRGASSSVKYTAYHSTITATLIRF